jgi:hypothetical protein
MSSMLEESLFYAVQQAHSPLYFPSGPKGWAFSKGASHINSHRGSEQFLPMVHGRQICNRANFVVPEVEKD